MSSVLEQRSRQIAVARIRQEDDDVLTCILGALSELYSRVYSRACRDTYKHALGSADQPACFKGVVILYGDDLVIHLCVENIRHKACADALYLVRACGALGEHGG